MIPLTLKTFGVLMFAWRIVTLEFRGVEQFALGLVLFIAWLGACGREIEEAWE